MTDFLFGETFDLKFTTRRFSTGAPFTLAGTPTIAAYHGNSLTEITAGITLTVDFDGITGLNNVRVVATIPNGFVNFTTYSLVITAGTVDAVSVVGEVVGSFTLGRSAAFTRLGPPAGASVSADIATIEAQTDDIGAAGAGLTAIPNLDAAISSRMATFTLPANFSALSITAGGLVDITQAAADKVWSTVARILTAGTNIVLAKGTGVTGFNDLAAAAVNAEVVDVIRTDLIAQPGQGTPTSDSSLHTMIQYLFKAWRNRTTQSASQYSLYNDDAVTIDQKATFSDNGTTADRVEIATGP